MPDAIDRAEPVAAAHPAPNAPAAVGLDDEWESYYFWGYGSRVRNVGCG